jgi:hypothetical protein
LDPIFHQIYIFFYNFFQLFDFLIFFLNFGFFYNFWKCFDFFIIFYCQLDNVKLKLSTLLIDITDLDTNEPISEVILSETKHDEETEHDDLPLDLILKEENEQQAINDAMRENTIETGSKFLFVLVQVELWNYWLFIILICFSYLLGNIRRWTL